METNLEQCPLCGSELSQTKFREIRAKLRDQEQKKAAELAEAKLAITRGVEAELKKEFEQQRQAAEKKVREEADLRVKKALAEREQVAKKLMEAQQREGEIRKQAQLEIEKQKQVAEKQAKADAEQQIKKVTAERDQAATKLKAAEAREAEIRKQTQEEAERQRQKELTEQRQALEKDKKLALLKQQSEFNRERESLQKKLERKTANELGDGGEIDVFESLRESFDGNGGKTTRIPKGQAGADMLHEVFHKGEMCGRIIVDAKNRQGWQNSFVTKLRQDQVEAGAEHAILATTVFPAGKKEMCIESGVIVISPARVVHIVQLLRQAMITMHVKGLSMKERTSKMSRLYKLITSESYAAKFTEANRLTQDILELEVQEKTAHDNVWKRRGALVKRMHNVLREVETEVAAVIEGNDEVEQALPIFDSKRVAMGSASGGESAMNQPVTLHCQERRLGRTLLRTYRDTVDLNDVFPNEKQPRMGPKEDPELQRQIEANEGIFEPLLLEPHPHNRDKFRIIDGDRRWTNSKILVEVQKKDQYRLLPAEITDRTLTDEERLRVWIYIHRQRREWDTKEKEMVAYSLVNMVGRASAANILGITVREVDKLVEIYDLSLKLTNLVEPGASITWAREIKNLNKKLLTPSVLDDIVKKINEQEITNSKDIRKLRQILKDPVAKENFVSEGGSIETALRTLGPASPKKAHGLLGDIEQISESLQRYSWTTLAALKGDQQVLRKLEETEKLLKELKKALSR